MAKDILTLRRELEAAIHAGRRLEPTIVEISMLDQDGPQPLRFDIVPAVVNWVVST